MFKKTFIIGISIQKERKARGMSRQVLANLVYCTIYVIRCIEEGGFVSEESLKLICDVLMLDFDALVKEEEKEQQRQKALRNAESMLSLNLTANEQEAIQSVVTKFSELPKRRSFKRVISILVTVAMLTIASTVAYAQYKKNLQWKIAAVDTEHGRIVVKACEEGKEDDFVYHAPEDDVFPDYVRGVTYQTLDERLWKEYEEKSGKTNIKCVTAEGQEYLYTVQEAENLTAEHIKKALNYDYKEKNITLDDQTVTLYYTEKKAMFLLENLLYVFQDYSFSAEQLISIIKNMEKQIVHRL